METTKIHLNSTISTLGARFGCANIGNFYTTSRLKESKYMKKQLKYIIQEIIDEHDVMQYVDENGFVYCDLVGAIYGLKQAGKIANEDPLDITHLQERQACGLMKHNQSVSNLLSTTLE